MNNLPEQAAAVYRHWLADEPGNAEARHHLAGLTGEGVPERASDDYVRATFDRFATSFDEKLSFLGYRAPELVAGVVRAQCAGAEGRLRVADAGCGTGLCAPLLAPFARTLAGVDLSGAMLERAQVRGGYDELIEGDLIGFLDARPAAFDLLVSADTLCYFGALETFARSARASLIPGALVVFTVEAHDDVCGAADFRLHPHGRYSHRRDYVSGVLGAAGFTGIECEPVVLRQEAKSPVHGWLVHARAGGG